MDAGMLQSTTWPYFRPGLRVIQIKLQEKAALWQNCVRGGKKEKQMEWNRLTGCGGTLEEDGGWKEGQSQVGEVREERQTGSAAFNHTKFTQYVENKTTAMSHIITRLSCSQNGFHVSLMSISSFHVPSFILHTLYHSTIFPPCFSDTSDSILLLDICGLFFSPSLGSVGRKRSYFRPHWAKHLEESEKRGDERVL